jgi:hypothetical protein
MFLRTYSKFPSPAGSISEDWASDAPKGRVIIIPSFWEGRPLRAGEGPGFRIGPKSIPPALQLLISASPAVRVGLRDRSP